MANDLAQSAEADEKGPPEAQGRLVVSNEGPSPPAPHSTVEKGLPATMPRNVPPACNVIFLSPSPPYFPIGRVSGGPLNASYTEVVGVPPNVPSIPLVLPDIPPPRDHEEDYRTYLARQQANKRRKLSSSPPPQPRASIYSQNQLDVMQSNEAQTQQYEVEHGLCWRQCLPLDHIPAQCNLCCGENNDENNDEPVFPQSEWTSTQKAQFIELLGRRGRERIPEIARIIGKSVVECKLYLEALHTSSEAIGPVIDVDEIPASEEVPTCYLEADIGEVSENIDEVRESIQNQLLRSRRLNTRSLLSCVVQPSQLTKMFSKPVDSMILPSVQAILRTVLQGWISVLMRLVPWHHTVVLSARDVCELMVENKQLFPCFRGFLGSSEKTQTSEALTEVLEGPLAAEKQSQRQEEALKREISEAEEEVYYEDTENSESDDSGSEFVDPRGSNIEYWESNFLRLCAEEEEWLDQMDTFRSQLSLYNRGFIPYLTVQPPPFRSPELEQFMRSGTFLYGPPSPSAPK